MASEFNATVDHLGMEYIVASYSRIANLPAWAVHATLVRNTSIRIGGETILHRASGSSCACVERGAGR